MRICIDIEANALINPTCEQCGKDLVVLRSGKRFCSVHCINKAGRIRKPVLQMLQNARRRARDKNIQFDLKEEDINIPQFCPLLGIELRQGVGSKNTAPDIPSLDRIDNSKGYIKDNVWVISNRANRLKGDATLDELKQISSYFK